MKGQAQHSGSFQLLAGSSEYRRFAPAFREATGFSLTLAPVDGAAMGCCWASGKDEPELCRLVRRFPAGQQACKRFQRRIIERAEARQGRHCEECFAGVQVVTVPIFNVGGHVATLMAGKAPASKKLQVAGCRLQVDQSQLATFSLQPSTPCQVTQARAATELLRFLARTLEEHLPAWVVSNGKPVPPAVSKARDYIGRHLEDTLRLASVARHAGLSVQHFCEVFKTNTGLTFKQFVARSRTEKAKALLRQPSLRITDIGFDCGFKSVPTFNRVFKQLTRRSPTQYRAELRGSWEAGGIEPQMDTDEHR
jgi:AraC-like DNA-binding protein